MMGYISNSLYPSVVMLKISVYGKGGIGKSTLSANISYVLSKRGSVLHVGCDPKADSTRLLAGGQAVATFLSGAKPVTDGSLTCIECGGPGAGKGCAGKGLAMMFESIKDVDADYRVCDVLGDVVCGGFSVPMREGNVDLVILMTSEEYMSVYAMNNILRGMRNINDNPVVFGIVLNSRGGDEAAVRRFSEAVGIPIVLEMSRSNLFLKAEQEGRTLCELYPDSCEAGMISRLCDSFANAPRYRPACLTEESMEAIARGRPGVLSIEPATERAPTFESFDADRNVTYKGDFIMPACTSHGAADLAMMLTDAAVILHGPRNCAFLMEFAFSRRIALSKADRRGVRMRCNIYSTGLDAMSAFAGGTDPIHETSRRVRDDGFRTAFLIPTCSSEIMALDLGKEAAKASEELLMNVIPVKGDPVFLSSKYGSAMGFFDAFLSLADTSLDVVPGTVNVFSRAMYGMGADESRENLDRLLSLLGLKVNVRMMNYTSVEEASRFCTGEFDLGLRDSDFNRRMSAAIMRRLGRREPLLMDIPDGLAETEEWLSKAARYTGREDMLQSALEAVRKEYSYGILESKPRLEGKRVAIFSTFNRDVEWQVETLKDVGVEIAFIMFGTDSFDDHEAKVPSYGDIPVMDGEMCDLEKAVAKDRPDVVITNSPKASRLGIPYSRLGSPKFGVEGAAEWLRLLADSMRLPAGRGWRDGL